MADPVVPLTPTALTVTQFRAMFTVFRDPTVWPDGEIAIWLALADKMINQTRWADIRDTGMALYAAHFLILAERDKRAGDAGGIPGAPTAGIMGSKSVGGVSVSYDTQIGLDPNAGFWNLTSYGLRFYRLMRIVGMGGTQISSPNIPTNDSFGQAWPGVIYPHF